MIVFAVWIIGVMVMLCREKKNEFSRDIEAAFWPILLSGYLILLVITGIVFCYYTFRSHKEKMPLNEYLIRKFSR